MLVVDIWKFKLNPRRKDIEKCWAMLSSEEKQKAHAFLRKSLQHSYIITRGTVKSIISSYLNINPLEVLIHRTLLGKPFIKSDPPCYFNVTHSENYALCAVCATAEIGVDVEYITRKPNIDIISEYILTPEEQLEFNRLPINRQNKAFFEIWTRKEAFVKCLGMGLQYDLKNCLIGFTDFPEIYENTHSGYKKTPWFIQDIEVDENYKAAVVVAHNSSNATLRYFNASVNI